MLLLGILLFDKTFATQLFSLHRGSSSRNLFNNQSKLVLCPTFSGESPPHLFFVVSMRRLKRQHEESILEKEATTVEEKWDDVLKNKSSVPQELHCVIEHQRTMCSNIIQNKGATLAALQVR